MKSDAQEALAALLSETGSAHGAYEESELGGVYDQDWPDWYAAYLIEHGVNQLVGPSLTVAHLSRLLKSYHNAYQQEQPSEDWPTFYARQLVALQ